MFGGGLVARRAGRVVRTQRIFIQFRAAKMHNTLVLLVWLSQCSSAFELTTVRAFSKSLNPLSMRLGPPFIRKGVATVAHRRWQATVV